MNAQLELRDMLTGFVLARALQVIAELGVADQLRAGPMDCEALARATGAHPTTLQRILRLLASHGVFKHLPDGRYRNSALSEYLRDEVPGSLRGTALLYGDPAIWRAWEGLLHSARTGEPSFRHVHGETMFDYLSQHPDSAWRFDRAMASSSALMNRAIVEAYDWKQFGTLVDVAGGTGSTLAAILEANPQLHGVLLDRAHVIERARQFLGDRGLLERCRLEAGDFFVDVPGGADAYFMKHIIHDWDDEDCRRILRACRAAMPEEAKLLICEKVMQSGPAQRAANRTDLVMLVLTDGGRERTEAEFRDLLSSAGFRLARIVATRADNSVLEAVRA